MPGPLAIYEIANQSDELMAQLQGFSGDVIKDQMGEVFLLSIFRHLVVLFQQFFLLDTVLFIEFM